MPVNTPFPVDTAMANASSYGRSRTQSTSSDRPSTIGVYGLMSPPLSISPEAAFIAASAASQIVTNDHDTQAGIWYDQAGIEPAEETAAVTDGALQLANNFVDQLLFNILATARSTTLPSLRTAVTDILKPKLAKDVIQSADEELREYLGGGEIESLTRSDLGVTQDWDLELVWKRTRLRCMVYSSLGDMEEEDEDYYIEQSHLNGENSDALAELVSPAVAIFLTSILEYVGEQVLIVAGQAAFSRMRANYDKGMKDGSRLPTDAVDRLVVEELDMERVALDRTFGRLWRAWKKRIRSPVEPNFSRPFSRSSVNSSVGNHQRRASVVTEPTTPALTQEPKITIDSQPSLSNAGPDDAQESTKNMGDLFSPSKIPLPDSDIEASYSDEEESEAEAYPSRPKSWVAASQVSGPGNTFANALSVKRTPSLPSREKPRHTELSSGKDKYASTYVVTPRSGLPQTKAELDAITTSGARVDETTDTSPSGISSVLVQAEATDTRIDDELEEFVNEAEIMTSSRVSIEGRSSPIVSEPGRPLSIIHTRSSSVGSVRVIDVQGPRSRASSVESNPRSPSRRSLSVSREGSVSQTPPIVEENDQYSIPHVTVTNPAPEAALSIEEDARDAGSTLTPPKRNRSPPKSITPPILSHTLASSKAPVAVNTTSSIQEERYESLQRLSGGLRHPPMPTLPERSTSRPIYVQAPPAQRTSPESPRFPRSLQGEISSAARFKPSRTSEENNLFRPAAVTLDFEQLIQSNETLQYTLTPENMRNIDSHSPQPLQGHKIKRSGESKISTRSQSPSIMRPLSLHKATGLGSHPTNMEFHNTNSNTISRGTLRSPPQARDARIPRESIQDFADFIRSTGPPGVNFNRVSSANSLHTLNTTRSDAGSSPLKKSSSMEARRGPKLQARDATVNSSGESSELIDFIRQGPPSTNGNSPRIPRTVAPFRNTQDSDYMASAFEGKSVDAVVPDFRVSQASTNFTEVSAPSSMNSQSALLNKSNRQQLYMGNSFDEDDILPKRTRRRVQDPYAIDYSDEDDDEFDIHPKPPQKQEESLIDFLNNYVPPTEPLAQQMVPPKKKSNTPNLIARLRTGSSASIGSSHSRKRSSISDKQSPVSRASSRATHTPIVIPSGPDQYSPPGSSPRIPRTDSFGRISIKRFDSRDTFVSNSQTTDLPKFLRESRSPSSMTNFPSSEDKTSTGLSRMFERRKKPAAY